MSDAKRDNDVRKIAVSLFLYARLLAMADQARMTVPDLVAPWLEDMAALDDRKRSLVMRYAALLRDERHKEWADIIETLLDRAENL